jgi:pimeloyl-ACP methyl ester carboxylesterase
MQPEAAATGAEYLVRIDVSGARLEGQLVIPPRPCGAVLFADGSAGSRHSPRSQTLARSLRRDASVATLLVDLLSSTEEALDARTAELRFDVPFLARRLLEIAKWIARDRRTLGLPLGLFGSGTGAAAALITAAERPEHVEAVVSRGGRLDLAGAAVLARVRAPSLLIVGSNDAVALDINRQAQRVLRTESRLEVIHGASHLFEEPGTLDEVARLAADWFHRFLGRGA